MEQPVAGPLRMYGTRSDAEELDWPWVASHLEEAAAYWITTPTTGHPHPRPVWGLWYFNTLLLSIGSPTLRNDARAGRPITAHLESTSDVVIVEGYTAEATTAKAAIDAYTAKYDWAYEVAEYGPLTIVKPTKVIAWRAAGWAGRDGFEATGRWSFGDENG